MSRLVPGLGRVGGLESYLPHPPYLPTALTASPAPPDQRLHRPVPVNATVVGLFVALLVTTREAVRAPAARGLKVTVARQLAPTARLPGQLSPVSVKSPLLVPPIVPSTSVRAAPPLLVNVSVRGVLVVPTA